MSLCALPRSRTRSSPRSSFPKHTSSARRPPLPRSRRRRRGGRYAIAFLLILLHANVGFASGYAVATAAIVTLGSAVLAFLIVDIARWDWNALFAEILGLGGFAFAVVSNAIFLVASIRYARAIHPRLHLGGFLLGVAASLTLLFLYARILA